MPAIHAYHLRLAAFWALRTDGRFGGCLDGAFLNIRFDVAASLDCTLSSVDVSKEAYDTAENVENLHRESQSDMWNLFKIHSISR